MKERSRKVRVRVMKHEKDWSLMALRMEEGAMNQRMQAAEKVKKPDLAFGLQKGTQPCPDFGFKPRDLCHTSDLQNRKIINVHGFYLQNVW